jgi:hypothetical protein
MGSEAIIVPALFFTVGYVVWVVAEAFGRRQRLRVAAEFHSKLLERIGSAAEFGQFLTSEGGSRFTESLSASREGAPHTRILRAVQAGIVILFVGAGLFIFTAAEELPYAPERNVRAVSTIFTAVGLGLLVSAAVSYVLSRRMGLLASRVAGPGAVNRSS